MSLDSSHAQESNQEKKEDFDFSKLITNSRLTKEEIIIITEAYIKDKDALLSAAK